MAKTLTPIPLCEEGITENQEALFLYGILYFSFWN